MLAAPGHAATGRRGDVVVRWTVSDDLSGIASTPTDSIVSGEGGNLTASASMSYLANNSD